MNKSAKNRVIKGYLNQSLLYYYKLRGKYTAFPSTWINGRVKMSFIRTPALYFIFFPLPSQETEKKSP